MTTVNDFLRQYCMASVTWMFMLGGFLPVMSHRSAGNPPHMTPFVETERECPEKIDVRIFLSGSHLEAGTKHRAYHTTPKGFAIRKSTIPQAGLGAFTTTFIKAHTWLGEYEGIFTPMGSNHTTREKEYSWVIYRNRSASHYVDASDVDYSNWLRYVNCARHVTEENVRASMCYGRIHYMTMRDVVPATELLVYYGHKYAALLGIDVRQYWNTSHKIT